MIVWKGAVIVEERQCQLQQNSVVNLKRNIFNFFLLQKAEIESLARFWKFAREVSCFMTSWWRLPVRYAKYQQQARLEFRVGNLHEWWWMDSREFDYTHDTFWRRCLRDGASIPPCHTLNPWLPLHCQQYWQLKDTKMRDHLQYLSGYRIILSKRKCVKGKRFDH
jgi:hypothetical protein